MIAKLKDRYAAQLEAVERNLQSLMGDGNPVLGKCKALLDEHPDAYKDIDQVMADQQDLVEVQHVLHQVFNYKGVS